MTLADERCETGREETEWLGQKGRSVVQHGQTAGGVKAHGAAAALCVEGDLLHT